MAKRRGERRQGGELDEGPQESDLERFSDVTTRCKSCGAELYDDVEMCWKCGAAVGGSDSMTMPPKWVMITGGAILLLMLWWFLGR